MGQVFQKQIGSNQSAKRANQRRELVEPSAIGSRNQTPRVVRCAFLPDGHGIVLFGKIWVEDDCEAVGCKMLLGKVTVKGNVRRKTRERTEDDCQRAD